TQYWEHGPARQMSLGGVVSEATLFDDARLQLRRVTAGTVAAGNWEQKLHYCMGVDAQMVDAEGDRPENAVPHP
ncbi:MAG: hypothetical protein ACK5ZU_07265, partial [Acidobacteriota bacterium]